VTHGGRGEALPGSAAHERAPEPVPVRAYGYWEFVLRRLARDRVAVASAAVIALIVVACFLIAPLLAALLGHGPNDTFPYAIDENLSPAGPFSRVPDATAHVAGGPPHETTLLILGGDSTLGRDELLRILYGGRASLLVAIGAMTVSLTAGMLLGALAALSGGVVDWLVARLTEFVMAFPMLLLLMLIGATFSDRLDYITLGFLPEGVISLSLLIGAFTWFYPARLVRAEILSLRNREFVEAARMTGAGRFRVARTELLPHVAPVLLVYGSLAMATNIILEASISFLGIGLRLPTASWGTSLSGTWGTLLSPGNQTMLTAQTQLLLTLWPSMMIFATVLAFNLLGDSIRKAFEPSGSSL
jgi:ABC-type dipeptide/oligopeptide/nickel transport system permease subunit